MNAVAKSQELAPVAEGATILAVIDRAAKDPNTDVEKMERLMALYERIEAKRSESAFNEAMNAAQAEMRPISANATNPQTKSRYATFDKLDSALRPIYTNHGFSLSFDEGDSPKPDHVRVLCYVAHTGGHMRTYHRDIPADGKGAKGGDVMTKTHAAGAAGSYGARYLLKGIFNVAVGEDDKDGNDPVEYVTEQQVVTLREWIESTNSDGFKFLKWLKVDSLEHIPAKAYDTALAALRAKEKAK